MTSYKVCLIVLAMLCINNIGLLSLLGYFTDNEPTLATQAYEAKRTLVKAEEPVHGEIADYRNVDAGQELFQENSFSKSDAASITTLQQFIESESFIDALDAYQVSAHPRFMEKERVYKLKTATELYAALLESGSQADKQIALQVLMRYKLDELDSNQLKGLYKVPQVQEWNRAEILVSLMSMGDADGFDWAKEMISDGDRNAYLGSEIYSYLYDHDPKFVDDHLDSVDLNSSSEVLSVISFAMEDKDRANAFFSRNLDRILESDSSRIFRMTAHNTTHEFTRAQEEKLGGLLASTNRHKREFAIRLVRNIDDVSTLRNYYSSLERGRDKIAFLTELSQSRASAEQRALAKEIASSSNDPAVLQKFGVKVVN